MNKETIEHKERLKVLERNMGTTYYETGHLHLAISDAMKEYHQDKLKLLGLHNVSQQRELLLAYEEFTSYKVLGKKTERISKQMVEDYLANNCA